MALLLETSVNIHAHQKPTRHQEAAATTWSDFSCKASLRFITAAVGKANTVPVLRRAWLAEGRGRSPFCWGILWRCSGTVCPPSGSSLHICRRTHTAVYRKCWWGPRTPCPRPHTPPWGRTESSATRPRYLPETRQTAQRRVGGTRPVQQPQGVTTSDKHRRRLKFVLIFCVGFIAATNWMLTVYWRQTLLSETHLLLLSIRWKIHKCKCLQARPRSQNYSNPLPHPST